MKKSLIAAVLMVSVASLVYAAAGPNPANTVVKSSHDLSVDSDLGGQGQICVFCHTPHHAGDTNLPLWSRSLSAQTFTPYNNSDFSTVTPGQPGSISKACLGCHDGSIALGYIANGAFGTTTLGNGAHGARDAAGPSILAGDAMNIGQNTLTQSTTDDLSTTHPIGITYPAASPNHFKDVANNSNVKLFKEGTGTANQVECASCHEPHNQGAAEPRYFLRSTNAASALCTQCHIK